MTCCISSTGPLSPNPKKDNFIINLLVVVVAVLIGSNLPLQTFLAHSMQYPEGEGKGDIAVQNLQNLPKCIYITMLKRIYANQLLTSGELF